MPAYQLKLKRTPAQIKALSRERERRRAVIESQPREQSGVHNHLSGFIYGPDHWK